MNLLIFQDCFRTSIEPLYRCNCWSICSRESGVESGVSGAEHHQDPGGQVLQDTPFAPLLNFYSRHGQLSIRNPAAIHAIVCGVGGAPTHPTPDEARICTPSFGIAGTAICAAKSSQQGDRSSSELLLILLVGLGDGVVHLTSRSRRPIKFAEDTLYPRRWTEVDLYRTRVTPFPGSKSTTKASRRRRRRQRLQHQSINSPQTQFNSDIKYDPNRGRPRWR